MGKSLINIVSGLLGFETKEEIINFFLEEANKNFNKNKIKYSQKKRHADDIEITIGENQYGFLNFSGSIQISQEQKEELKEATKLLAFIISSKENNLQTNNKEEKNFFKNLIDTIPEPVFYKNKEGKYLGCNKAFADFLAMSSEEIIGKTVF